MIYDERRKLLHADDAGKRQKDTRKTVEETDTPEKAKQGKRHHRSIRRAEWKTGHPEKKNREMAKKTTTCRRRKQTQEISLRNDNQKDQEQENGEDAMESEIKEHTERTPI